MKILATSPINSYTHKVFIKNKNEHKKINKNFNNLNLQYNTSLSYITFKQNNVPENNEIKISKSKLISEGFTPAKIINNKIINRNQYIILSNKEDLKALANTPSAWNKEFVLTQDIDLEEENFKGIGSSQKEFRGIFNGNGYTIKGLKIYAPKSNNTGFFRTCNNAEIKNLTLENISVQGQNYVGAVVGFAENGTKINNVRINGNISGEYCVGGLVGNLLNSSIKYSDFTGEVHPAENILETEDEENSFFATSYEPQTAYLHGGIAGNVAASEILASTIMAKISGKNTVGGIAGSILNSKVADCFLSVETNGSNYIGGIAGQAQNVTVKNSFIDKNIQKFGLAQNIQSIDCYTRQGKINSSAFENWDKNIWNITDTKIPRLNSSIKHTSPIKIFLEDLNNDIQDENIKITHIHYEPPKNIDFPLEDMEPPKHYAKNEKVLSQIDKSHSPKELAKIFAYWVDGFRSGFIPEDKDHDEILLALVKKPEFDLSKKYLSNSGYSMYCTPLYVLSALNKGYIFREALKRSDIDPYVLNGCYDEVDMATNLFNIPITTNNFVLFESKNPIIKKYVKEKLTQNPHPRKEDKILEFIYSNPPENIIYNEEKRTATIPTEFLFRDKKDKPNSIHIDGQDHYNSIIEALMSPDIPGSYKDSQRNTIAHLLPMLSESEQIYCFEIWAKKGGDINIKNNDNKTPLDLAKNSLQFALISQMIDLKPSDLFDVDQESGNNLAMLNAIYNTSDKAIFLEKKLQKCGFSINTKNLEGSTQLHEAINKKNIGLINYLLTNGHLVDSINNNGQSPLHLAFMNKDITVIKWLLNCYAYPSYRDNLGLEPKNYWPGCEEILLANGIDIESLKKEYDISIGPVEKALNIEFKEQGLVSVQEPENVLYFKETIKKAYKNPETAYKNIMETINANPQNVRMYIDILIDSNSPHVTEILEVLLKNNMLNVDEKNKDEKTLLTKTIIKYYETDDKNEKLHLMKIFKTLLNNNANIDIPDENGQTSLHHCIFTKNLILFNELLGRHPNINATDVLGNNPLFYLGKDVTNPMRIAFDLYAKKRNIISKKIKI